MSKTSQTLPLRFATPDPLSASLAKGTIVFPFVRVAVRLETEVVASLFTLGSGEGSCM
jgi:hypothetical protein